MKNTAFTPEQQSALDAFDKAVESPDLNAFGHERKFHARRLLVQCADKLADFGIYGAMTPREAAEVRIARNYANPT